MAKGKSALALALKKKIGSNDEIQKVSHWIDSGFPPLNKAISGRYDGGFPCGRIVEVFGPPSAGKTFLATAAMVSAQKQDGLAVFLDHENSFDVGLAVANGLNADEDDGQWVYKQPDTFEDSVELIGTIPQAGARRRADPRRRPYLHRSRLPCVNGAKLQSREVRQNGGRYSEG
ncbi:hypothetical protein LNO36_30005 [Klebsiella variicola subsp. variicola]|nr:hypothetical protein [Klebsiella variicola subsp. variicola]